MSAFHWNNSDGGTFWKTKDRQTNTLMQEDENVNDKTSSIRYLCFLMISEGKKLINTLKFN